MQEFITWETLTTFGGAALAVTALTQALKRFVAVDAKWIALVLALIVAMTIIARSSRERREEERLLDPHMPPEGQLPQAQAEDQAQAQAGSEPEPPTPLMNPRRWQDYSPNLEDDAPPAAEDSLLPPVEELIPEGFQLRLTENESIPASGDDAPFQDLGMTLEELLAKDHSVSGEVSVSGEISVQEEAPDAPAEGVGEDGEDGDGAV